MALLAMQGGKPSADVVLLRPGPAGLSRAD